MVGKLLSLLLLGLPVVAEADVCPTSINSVVGCNFATGVLPYLEALGIPVADANQYTQLSSTEEGKPFAEVNFVVHSKPMTDAAADAVNEANLDQLSSKITREAYNINCGSRMRAGAGLIYLGPSFVQAGGVVSYRINILLANEDGKFKRSLSFGETTIVSCGE